MTWPGPTLFPGPDTYPAQPVFKMAALPNFRDGQLIAAADLTALSTSIDTLARITIGRDTELSNTTGLPPTGRPAVKCYLSNPVQLTSGDLHVISWDTAVVDTENQWRPPAPTQLRVQVDGWYRVELQAAFQSAAPGERAANLHVNGTTLGQIVASSSTVLARSNTQCVQVVAYAHLTQGSVIYASVRQSSLPPTTISANTAKDATTITVADSIPAGTTVIIDLGYTDQETVLVQAVSGTGPFTLTVTTDLTGATSSGMTKAHFAGYHVTPVVDLLPQSQRGTWISMRWVAPFGQGTSDNPAATTDSTGSSGGGSGGSSSGAATPSTSDPDLYTVTGISPAADDPNLYRFTSPTPTSADPTLFND